MKTIKIINIILILLAIILTINLIRPFNLIQKDILFSPQNLECYLNSPAKLNELPIDRCCYEIQRQLSCEYLNATKLKCYTSETSERYYLINAETLNYCKKEGYDVKAE